MMINKSNLGQYINFLHKKRKGTEASQELISQWSHVEDQFVASELNKLYGFWQLTQEQIHGYEQEFIANLPNVNSDFIVPQNNSIFDNTKYNNQSYSPTAQQPKMPSGQAYAQYPPTKKGLSAVAIVAIILGVVILVPAIGYGVYRGLQSQDKANASSNVGPVREVVAPLEDAKSQVKTQEIKPTELIDERDVERKTSQIRSLLKAEEHQHFSNIMDHFSPKIQRYWDLKNPTRDQMYDMYRKSWEKALDFTYRNVEVKRITNNLYEMTADYSYFSIKDDANKSMKIKNKYEFDSNGLIIKAYGSSQ